MGTGFCGDSERAVRLGVSCGLAGGESAGSGRCIRGVFSTLTLELCERIDETEEFRLLLLVPNES